MNPRKNPLFTFEIFGSLGTCWLQRDGIVGYNFSNWELGASCDHWSDMENNYWREDELADFVAIFGTCFSGDLTVGDLLPTIKFLAENASTELN